MVDQVSAAAGSCLCEHESTRKLEFLQTSVAIAPSPLAVGSMASPRPWPVLVLLLLLVLAAAPFTTTTQAHTLPAAVAPARASKCVSSPDFPQNCTIRVASLPNCIVSCLNKTTGVETCACCMAGLRLLPNKQCKPCPTGSFARMADNVCSPCHEGRTTTGPGSSVCSVCAAGYGWRPPTVHTGPWCQRCPQCSYGPGNTTAPCKACDPGFTTNGPGASECIPAVCASLPDPVPGVAAWPSQCTGTSSCTASCTAGFSGEVTAVCGCDQKWLAPTTTCEPEASQIWRGTLRASKTLVAAGSSSELLFTVKFDAALPATAGPVKLYSCGATPNGPPGILGLALADMMDDGNNTSGDTADGDGIYSVKLAVQFTRGNESRCYTVVVGAAEAAPGTAPIDMGNAVTVTSFAGCSSPPPEVPEGTSYPWDHPAAAAQCRDVPVDFACSANCREPYAYGPGRISRCLGGDVWTGPTGFCEPWVCTPDPFPQLGLPVTCERKGQAGYAPGALCTAPCPQGRSGSGYKALCTQSRTWEVTVECTGNCTSLPSPDPPGSYSDRWAPTCIGLAENQTCTAECSCSGAKFVAECDTNGSYVVKPGACNACPGPIINGSL
ncbi:hypothetical protein OEZ85_002081 [Tetradesmus obliquus]|uniref:Tyrosine-protein kinase ephrin type A/B receptor-like domain-containing protein n=1 Tax=Tetradesmus obliquus TaxID=3088 RepID=A0ABY8U249_TETOB|nr:hypothetical protein OEZ85_002081 [Tetradesmus obliquus]